MRLCVFVNLKIKVSDESAVLQSIHFFLSLVRCVLSHSIFRTVIQISFHLPLKIKAIKNKGMRTVIVCQYRAYWLLIVFVLSTHWAIHILVGSISTFGHIDTLWNFPKREQCKCVCMFVREKIRIMRSQKFEYIFRRREKQNRQSTYANRRCSC